MTCRFVASVLALAWLTPSVGWAADSSLRAGASAIDISPRQLPAIRNGGFLEATSARVDEPLFARSLVLSGAGEHIVLSIVDSCMLPTDVCDAIKADVSRRTGIAGDQILISATHTHSAPSTMDLCLGSRRDEAYTSFLIGRVADGIVAAWENLRPAKLGHAAVDAHQFTNCRRWIVREDRLGTDPFGGRTVRAMMHPGYQNPNYVGPAGPIDPQLSLLSVVAESDDSPICVMANFSMHYFGAGGGFSPDYFGDVAKLLEHKIGDGRPMVGIMSQGTSGDLHWMDYSRPRRDGLDRQAYSQGLARIAVDAWKQIEHTSDVSLAMAEKRISIRRRTPNAERLAWASELNAQRGDRRPKDRPEVYAEQAAWIDSHESAEVVLQALRIGDLGITAIPNEVYGITGLKLKQQSPLSATFNLELSNGAEGYIPPPEQHALGGYTTWPARTAGLDQTAEPRIVETLLSLLEQVSGKPRRKHPVADGRYSKAIVSDKPVAYWRCEDWSAPTAVDRMHRHHAELEDGIAFRLPGVRQDGGAVSAPPERESAFTGDRSNHAWHFAGGRMVASGVPLGKSYSVSLWFWNGIPHDAKPVTGYLFSRGKDGDRQAVGEHLGIGGNHHDVVPGVLFFYTGNEVGEVVAGTTRLALRDWHHVTLVRDGRKLAVYLDGKPEIETEVDWTLSDPDGFPIFVGGRCDHLFGLEGKTDEVAVFDRPLSAAEVAHHFQISQRVAPSAPLPQPDSPPLSLDQSLQRIHLPEGFEVEVVAAEPLVKDPVAFDWDSSGRLWVVEMADYPLGIDGQGSAGGRVRVLSDTDDDGRYDSATLFADGLSFPNGILTWRDGVIVTAAPDVLLLTDRDGDGRADHREVLLTGLQEGNQQLRANGLRWGLDHWVYVASGGHHGNYGLRTKVHSTRANVDVTIGSRDFRFRPDTGEIEPQSGPTQFGRNRDDWGHWFGTQNSHPLWHYVLDDDYLKRNPHYVAPEVRHQLFPTNPTVYPASPLQKRYHNFQQAGRFTSACGGMIYRDRELFEDGTTHAFVCEPFQNLVQHSTLEPLGVTFAATRVGGEDETDFFASEDRWCRPVMARTGPDGALWIADMYRYMIEHPQWLPEQGKAELLPHYRLGEHHGRIYRVFKKGHAKQLPRLTELDQAELVAALDSANGSVRDKVHQMLLWSHDARSPSRTPQGSAVQGSLIATLRHLAASSHRPQARLHAICLLEGFGALTPELLLLGLSDDHPGVRENAIRIAESLPLDRVAAALDELSRDPDARVRMQLALSLGQWGEPEAGRILADLLSWHGDDPWIATAVFSSSLPHLPALSQSLVIGASDHSRLLVQQLLQISLGAGDRVAIERLLAPAFAVRTEPLTVSDAGLLTLLLDVLADNSTTIKDLASQGDDARDEPDELSQMLAGFDRIVKTASQSVSEFKDNPPRVIAIAALLTRLTEHREQGMSLLENQLDQATSQPQFQSILDVLRASGDVRVPEILFSCWQRWSPGFRTAAVDVLLSRETWTQALISEVVARRIGAADIDPARRMQLLNHRDAEIKQLAADTFQPATNSPSKRVQQYRGVLQLAGDTNRGLAVYKKACASCHRSGELGHQVGPDLNSVVDHSPHKILTNILDPNLDIQPGYQAYACLLVDGEVLFGLIASENATGIVFKLNDGRTRTILRKDIETLKNIGVSLMPENLESIMTQQDIADVIAFLRKK
jgi:putative membrane-bound dehydrogenase-like protein